MADIEKNTESLPDPDLMKFFKITEVFSGIVHALIKWGGILGIMYFLKEMVIALAGKLTIADFKFVLQVLGDKYISQIVAILFGGGGLAYGLRQRKLRQDVIQNLGDHNKFLEAKIDERRTTSHLTPRGNTHPKDK